MAAGSSSRAHPPTSSPPAPPSPASTSRPTSAQATEAGGVVGFLEIRRAGCRASAEDAVQAALVRALDTWPDDPPRDPKAWLVADVSRHPAAFTDWRPALPRGLLAGP
ncbi:sigma factor [Actinoallomurus acanthiterrae]